MKDIKNYIGPLFIILMAVLIRLFPHPANFAPIAAMALFGGTYLNRKYSLIIVFCTLIVSDYLLLYINPFSPQFINFSKLYSPQSLIHASTLAVYGSFLVVALIGIWLRSHKSVKNIIAASLSSSILFFLITNFNFFYATSLYPKNIDGMLQAYVMAIPFFKNTLAGDIFYVALFFGSFEAAIKLSKQNIYAYLYKNRRQG
ncbi:MAG: hypothetical protein KBD51_00305 [Candidatus Levybacteria bacterium]|nr:hypothetical protein [Candidatus Levybacteria bacterium]